MTSNACPVCLNAYSTTAKVEGGVGAWGYRVDCPICGRFDLVREAFDDFLDPLSAVGSKLTAPMRARIAFKLRTGIAAGASGLPRLTSEFLDQYIKTGCPGPSPGEQAVNAIRFIGDEISPTGEHIESLPDYFFIFIGAPSPSFAGDLLFELKDSGQIEGYKNESMTSKEVLNVSLTLNGWRVYDEERRGKIAGTHGFLAMKFGDSQLEALVKDAIKPAIKSELNFDLFDMRDVARAGVIDNIMRAQIRDAAFVIVDLTHDNSGAYWEAGYAEGLGKPVVYICEKEKFDLAKTHFDTNHCTTVIWSTVESELFVEQLIATLRRSLNLF